MQNAMTTEPYGDEYDALRHAMSQARELTREERLLNALIERFKAMLKSLPETGSFDEIGLHRQPAIDLIYRYRREVVTEATQ